MNAKTILLRQINPSFVDGGSVTSQAFKPTPKDENKLSVYDGDLISPKDSFNHFVSRPACYSLGVMGLSCAECAEESLIAQPDTLPFPEHAIIDFSLHNETQIRKKAKKLRDIAVQRGWLYRQ